MLDIVADVAEETDKRDVSLPIWDKRYAWWTEAVQRAKKNRGVEQTDLATRLGFDTGKISRAISRKKPLYDAVMAISRELEVPPPAILPESEDEAVHLVKQLRFFRSEREVERLKAESIAAARAKDPKESSAPQAPTRKKRPTRKPRTE